MTPFWDVSLFEAFKVWRVLGVRLEDVGLRVRRVWGLSFRVMGFRIKGVFVSIAVKQPGALCRIFQKKKEGLYSAVRVLGLRFRVLLVNPKPLTPNPKP